MALNTEQLRFRGMKLLKRGAFAEAAEQFRRVVREEPGSVSDQEVFANALARAGKVAEAVAVLESALEAAPNAARLHGLLGHILARGEQRVRAIRHFERSLALAPDEGVERELQELKALITRSVHNWHLLMLADTTRNDAFQAAIEAAVRPDDLVLDIGTGTGLLAMMAARAGAAQVVACEIRPDVAEMARIIVEENGYGSQISVVCKHSSALEVGVDLPRQANLLISETVDAILVGEGMLNTFQHARDVLLAPDARMIPFGGAIRGQLAMTPRLKHLHPLKGFSGFDMRVFARHALKRQFYPLQPRTEWTALSAPFDVAQFDFRKAALKNRRWEIVVPVTESGTLQSLVLWFDLHLDERTSISSGPDEAPTHWDRMVFLFDRQREVRAGDAVTVFAELGGGERVYFEM